MKPTLSPRESVILAEDWRALVDWYVGVLGFHADRTFEDKFHYCNLSIGAMEIGIGSATEMGVAPVDRKKNTVVLQFEVPDVQEFFDYLKEHGGAVTFGPSFDPDGEFYFGGFEDPEGNPFWVVDSNCPRGK